jgi:hypothetical protein
MARGGPQREAVDAARQARRRARQRVVDYRIEQLDALVARVDALRDAVVPRQGREEEVARAFEDVHRMAERLAAILRSG